MSNCAESPGTPFECIPTRATEIRTSSGTLAIQSTVGQAGFLLHKSRNRQRENLDVPTHLELPTPFGTAGAACCANSGVRVSIDNRICCARHFIGEIARQKIGVSEIRKSAGHFSVSFTQRTSAAYFSGVKSALNRKRSCGSMAALRSGLFAV